MAFSHITGSALLRSKLQTAYVSGCLSEDHLSGRNEPIRLILEYLHTSPFSSPNLQGGRDECVREQNLQERHRKRVLQGEETRALAFCPRLSRGATLYAEQEDMDGNMQA